MSEIFTPSFGSITSVSNAISATAAVSLPRAANGICLTNTSTTATTYVYVTSFDSVTTPAGTAPTATTGFPVLPGGQIILRVGSGGKVIRTIASAADGAIIIVPGSVD